MTLRKGQHRSRAGESSVHRFDHLLSRWRSRKRRAFVIAGAVLLAPCVAVAILTEGVVQLASVFLAGAYVGMLSYAWDSPPEYIERLRRGAEGERRTAKALARLDPQRWVVVHDVDRGYGNWDHIVVGKAGVYLLDSKNLLGRAAVEGGVLVLRRHETPESPTRFDRLGNQMRAAAVQLSRALTQEGGKTFVRPVVVVWPEMTPEVVEAEGVTYVDGTRLVQWLEEQPNRGPAERAKAIEAALKRVAAEHRADVAA